MSYKPPTTEEVQAILQRYGDNQYIPVLRRHLSESAMQTVNNRRRGMLPKEAFGELVDVSSRMVSNYAVGAVMPYAVLFTLVSKLDRKFISRDSWREELDLKT